jgi:hypothetical protein
MIFDSAYRATGQYSAKTSNQDTKQLFTANSWPALTALNLTQNASSTFFQVEV